MAETIDEGEPHVPTVLVLPDDRSALAVTASATGCVGQPSASPLRYRPRFADGHALLRTIHLASLRAATI